MYLNASLSIYLYRIVTQHLLKMTAVIKNENEPKGESEYTSVNFNANAIAKQKRELTIEEKEKAQNIDLQERKSYTNFSMKDGEEFIIRTTLDKIDWKLVDVFR